jgi:hypothetical protein
VKGLDEAKGIITIQSIADEKIRERFFKYRRSAEGNSSAKLAELPVGMFRLDHRIPTPLVAPSAET